MKPPRTALMLALILAGGSAAFAQTNTAAAAPVDYATYSRFITDRNIFDPNRQPHTPATRTVRRTTRTRTSAAPAFTLVGTMCYEKGWFAFFNGNQDELRKALSTDQSIAGYTVVEITYGRVLLATTNQTENLQLRVGDVLRQEGGKWALSESRDLPASSNSSATDSAGAGSSESSASTPAASSASEPNEVLKRLMQKREQENK
jgi:hypothetical protein